MVCCVHVEIEHSQVVIEELVVAEVVTRFNIDLAAISAHRSAPEYYVLILPNEQVASQAYNDGSAFQFSIWFVQVLKMVEAGSCRSGNDAILRSDRV